jgi:hypothetical protein
VPGAAYRHIKLLAVDELTAAHRIDVDNYQLTMASWPACEVEA